MEKEMGVTPPETISEDFVFLTIKIPDNVEFMSLVSSALSQTLGVEVWQEIEGRAMPDDCNQVMQKMFRHYVESKSSDIPF